MRKREKERIRTLRNFKRKKRSWRNEKQKFSSTRVSVGVTFLSKKNERFFLCFELLRGFVER